MVGVEAPSSIVHLTPAALIVVGGEEGVALADAAVDAAEVVATFEIVASFDNPVQTLGSGFFLSGQSISSSFGVINHCIDVMQVLIE